MRTPKSFYNKCKILSMKSCPSEFLLHWIHHQRAGGWMVALLKTLRVVVAEYDVFPSCWCQCGCCCVVIIVDVVDILVCIRF